MEAPGPGLLGVGPECILSKDPTVSGPLSLPAAQASSTAPPRHRTEALGGRRQDRGRRSAHCPPVRLLSSGKPGCQLPLGQPQREKVTGWKSDLFEARSHPTRVPAALWEIHSWLGLGRGEAAFWGLRALGQGWELRTLTALPLHSELCLTADSLEPGFEPGSLATAHWRGHGGKAQILPCV